MQYLPFLLIILILVVVFIKKKSKKGTITVPENWHVILHENVLFYTRLSVPEQETFKLRMHLFLSEIYIDAIDFKLEELDRVFVAASAVIPVFRFPDWHYNHLTSVIIYPDNFNKNLQYGKNHESKWIAGMVGTGRFENQMILSRKALHHGFKNKTDKQNTAIHEFIHLLDKEDGKIDGIPAQFLANENIIPWLKLMHEEMEAINNDASDIRNYGGTKQSEFFAVAAEYFFERPALLRRKHPELYEMLLRCFT